MAKKKAAQKKPAQKKPAKKKPAKKKPAKKKPATTTKKKPSANTAKKSTAASRKKGKAATGRGKKKAAAAGTRQTTRNKQRPAAAAIRAGKSGFPIVAIGASAGGLEAMEELLDNMPSDTGIAFVIVTHQHPGHTSLLPQLLAKDTEMQVAEAQDGTRLRPNHVYVGPPGGHLAIINGTLHRMETEKKEAPRLPIDYFFRSLAEDQGERAIGIVLSGTGTDGTLGLKAIKGETGMAMVQQPDSAKYSGMPASAEATGLADYVLPPAEMPAKLISYAGGPYLAAITEAAGAAIVQPQPMEKIFVLLRTRTGHDFSAYKSSTIRRRIERRMNVHQIRKPNQYVRYLQENQHEIDVLFKELLISVTSFFRDAEAWEALAGGPLPKLLDSRPQDYTLRAWVPGCSTGEEVYSLAILLRECLAKAPRNFEVQIFGTDLDVEAIDAARDGRFPDGIGVDVAPERLERFFARENSNYRIRKDIREMAIFAPQNVIKDPPFTKLDILSCRNLLIYLNADLQKRLLPIFHYALKPGGLLILGPSESISNFGDLFETVDKKWKIFRRKETATAAHALPAMPAAPLPRAAGAAAQPVGLPAKNEPHITHLIETKLLSTFCPASVVLNERGDILHVQGRTGDYLELAQGQARTNVVDMAREGLPYELAAALRQAAATNKEVVRENLHVKTNGGYADINLSVVKITEPKALAGLLMATFRPVPQVKPAKKKGRSGKAEPDRIQRLENELQYLRETQQTTLEELETSNEELKSTNEELQSTNEELQSTNEELETSKEEMQSLNEELTTVNAELQTKVDELSEANDDMQNLLNSTNIATIFLDNDLQIKRYTEQARQVVTLRQTDVGRPLAELASNLEYDNLQEDCDDVLRTLKGKERKIHTPTGVQYQMRIMPYRTAENVIDGLVLTFVDIRPEAEISENIVDSLREPIILLDEQHRVVSCNNAFYNTFMTNARQTVGESIYELGAAQWDVAELRELLEGILARNTRFENYRVSAEFPRLGRRAFALNARRLQRETGLPGMILLALEDITTE